MPFLRFSIHGPDPETTKPWTLVVYRVKWEICPTEGSYVNHAGPFKFKTLAEAVAKVEEFQIKDTS